MRLIQFIDSDGARRVGQVLGDDRSVVPLQGAAALRDLALTAARQKRRLADLAAERATLAPVAYDAIEREGRLLSPIDHPDPAHCLVTGTGLSHLGSADARDQMHRKLTQSGDDALTDSMRMFRLGLEGGKPASGTVGVQPEWFYKGDGSVLAAPGAELSMPEFALDGGEEPEVAGVYVIGDDGTPLRIGFALGNEFSDHAMERINYLYLAHSKLRACAIGPELLLGELPRDIRGTSAILRHGETLWRKEFLTGEDNMCHTIANLEHHHFKNPQFRRPGDVHIHFFGTATLSFSDGVQTEPGDIFEIQAPGFGRALRNTLTVSPEPPLWPQAL